MSLETMKEYYGSKPLVCIHKGRVISTSDRVAMMFGRRHDNVVRDIRRIMAKAERCTGGSDHLGFNEVRFVGAMGRTCHCFAMTKDAFITLVTSFTASKAKALKSKFVATWLAAFDKMEDRYLAYTQQQAALKQDHDDLELAPAYDPKPMVTTKNGQAITTSLAVARRFGKEHRHVLRGIREVISKNKECGVGMDEYFGLCFKINELQNGKRQPYYTMTRDGFSLLVMGFTGTKAHGFKHKYVKPWLKAFDDKQAELDQALPSMPESDETMNDATVDAGGDNNTVDFKSLVRVGSDGQVIADSLEVARRFGKDHKSVLLAIRNLGCSDDFSRNNYKPRKYHNRGKEYPKVLMTRDGFSFLVMGFIGKQAAIWKEKFIKAFNMMEQELLRRKFNEEQQTQQDSPSVCPAQASAPVPLSEYDLEVQRLQIRRMTAETSIIESKADLAQFKAAATKLNVVARTLKEHGVSQNSALISANKFVVKHHAIDFLETVDLPADPRGNTYTPTQLGEMLDPKLSAQKINVILYNMGYQTKNSLGYWEPTDKSQGLYEFYDVAKTTDSGVPIKQLKWFSAVFDDILAYMASRQQAAKARTPKLPIPLFKRDTESYKH